ncbi:MAG TPA: hypothetical protein GX510_08285 [Firmicutes bacterium]|nr:hypothetical protein [Candidatus Fermentithermobacillaceae bacterium]
MWGGLMARFLRVGVFQDKLDRIIELCSSLRVEPEVARNARMKQALDEIAGLALGIKEFMNSFPSEPLIWTGRGDTDEVIAMLESLVAAAESAGQVLRKA